ncbi:uncharacterized protein LAESUDRAFT_75777 [Laetiporus sulphureus 93-53]|uniref:Uncharacterized protein n=1 Tax=Laetiporus sulphureus 93-53 TaxID=1314785 RepID=A0A165F0K0_9APHY|nr:uncharacterized protein LAESUDRAFT_75777 [Laetiporus sulphureus 93-53]KZT08108.1 hypothetical protein LAESUDRAFT_75777 [Laetiporus sulphureus 93-53]
MRQYPMSRNNSDSSTAHTISTCPSRSINTSSPNLPLSGHQFHEMRSGGSSRSTSFASSLHPAKVTPAVKPCFLCSRDSIPHIHKVLSSPSKTPSCRSPSCVRAALRYPCIDIVFVCAGRTDAIPVDFTNASRALWRIRCERVPTGALDREERNPLRA